jgi:hypothetical protein
MADIVLDARKVRPLLGANVSKGIMAVDAEIGDLVIVNDNEELILTDASAPATSTLAGQVAQIVGSQTPNGNAGAVKIGESVTVCWEGRVALNPGSPLQPATIPTLWLSETPGKLTDAAPVNARKVAAPISANVIFFNGLIAP